MVKENKVLYYCEKCGQPVFEKYGSGRFCSKSCANSHKHSENTIIKIRSGVLRETVCECQFCKKQFNNLTAMKSHERLCKNNPEKISNKAAQILHEQKLKRNVVVNGDSLNITNEELNNYRLNQITCEICGKTIEESVKWDSKLAPKNLCVDHDHTTKMFRGLLCQVCNRQLGWYENYKEQINSYLNKTSISDEIKII